MVISLPIECVSHHQGEGDNTDRPGALIGWRNQQFKAADISELPSGLTSIPELVSLKDHTSSFACCSPFNTIHIYFTYIIYIHIYHSESFLQTTFLWSKGVNVFFLY